MLVLSKFVYGVGANVSAGVVVGVSDGDSEVEDMFGGSVVGEVVGGVTVALITGLRLLLVLIATESAVMSIRTVVVSPSLISNLTRTLIFSEGTFSSAVFSFAKVAVASKMCKRIDV